MPTISVIVPVYKVEAYLGRCVDSLLSQTFSDFELILIDDGSPDSCGAICDAYARQDSRVRVIHQENGGLSAARNTGLDHARGEYLAFVDSDDWVHPRYLEILYHAVQAHHVLLARCELKEVHSPEEASDFYGPVEVQLKKPEDVYVRPGDSGILAYMVVFLYRRDLFDGIRLPVGKLYEDAFTTPRVIFQTEAIACVDVPLYYYFCRDGSIVRSSWTPKKLEGLEAFEFNLTYFEGHPSEKLIRGVVNDFVYQVIKQCHGIEASDLGDSEKKHYIRILGKKTRKWMKQYGARVELTEYQQICLYPLWHPVKHVFRVVFDKTLGRLFPGEEK